MKILRRILVAIAVISAMVTVASSAAEVTTLEATQEKIVLLIDWSTRPLTKEDLGATYRLGVENCKKYDRVSGKSLNKIRLNVEVIYVTFPCDDKNKAVDKYRNGTSKESLWVKRLISELRAAYMR